MRASVAVLAVLLLPAFSGCLSFLDNDKGRERAPSDPADVGYDPSTIRILGTKRTPATITSFDGTELAAVVYEPVTSDVLPGNRTPTWGAVVMVHGWGGMKEEFEGVSGGLSGQGVPAPEQVGQAMEERNTAYAHNRLEEFAARGLVALAYDVRGFGMSGGNAAVAGPAEMADLDAVLDYLAANHPVNGLFGVTGISYGGGHSYNALVSNPRVTTAVPQYGWVDLYDGLAPGNVPKLQWSATLLAGGAAGTKGRLDPMVAEWYQKAVSRSDLETVEAQMDLRSSLALLPATTKPLFLCQGMQETLFPQADVAWEAAGGFTRAYIFTGGHSADDQPCWDRSLQWFRHFLGGFDEGVGAWPALTTPGVEGGRSLDYPTFPVSQPTVVYPRDDLLTPLPSNMTFLVQQRLLANPLNEPSYAWDQLNLPTNGIPQQFRQDPSAVFFNLHFEEAHVLLGAAELRLVPAQGTTAPFQVTGILFKVDGAGKSQIVSRGAFAASDEGDLMDGNATLRFHWTKADFAPGDRLVLRIGANDESWFMPYPANYAVTFTGASSLTLPFFEG